MKNIFSLMFTLFVMVFMFTACEDKDEQIKPETPTCEVACDEATEACVCKEDKCACEKKEVPAPACEPACTDDKECKCVEAECACVPKVPEVPKCEDMKCAEDETCACDDKECKCEKKVEEPVEPKCDPACNVETEDCVCAEDKCECRAKDAPVEECFCDEGKTVKCPEGGKDACEAVPVNPPVNECDPVCEENKECKCAEEKCECIDKVVENVCKDKSEGDECGENKVCMKGEGEELACMDKPVEDPAPAEPEK